MKIIILAAGKGERLMPLTQNTPKPLLDMGNGTTLIEEQLQNLSASGVVDEVVLVIGYLAEQIEAKIACYRARGHSIRTIFNPFYGVSNNFMSLWLAKGVLDEDDVMITNGDNLFATSVFSQLAQGCGNGIHLAVSAKGDFEPEDMKVTLTEEFIARVSKRIPAEEAHAESPGLALVRGPRARALFTQRLELMARTGRFLQQFWLEVFNELYESGVTVHPWWFDAASLWQEVDFHLDLTRARSLLAHKLGRAGVPVPVSLAPGKAL